MRVKVEKAEDENTETNYCEVIFNEKAEYFMIYCEGFNNDWHVIDMNQGQVLKRGKLNIQFNSKCLRNLNY